MLSSVLAKNGNITTTEILICTGVALVLGIAISFVAGAILTFVIGVKDPEAQMSK